MCRLILAKGRFSARAIADAAVAMSEGHTAQHEGPIRCHPNGWGALWKSPGSRHGLEAHRDTRTILEGLEDSPVPRLETDFLAIHVRHATLSHTRGLEYTHPLQRGEEGAVPWYFMHNGFLPTVHRLLGMERSHFDSREYFDYIIPSDTDALDTRAALERLRAIPPGGSSGNAIAVNPRRAYLLHWSPADTPYPRYFQMHRLATPDFVVLASEIIPALGPAERWEPVPREYILEVPLEGTGTGA